MSISTHAARVLAASSLLALTACNHLPMYTPGPGEKTVNVSLLGYGDPYMCADGTAYKLSVEGTPFSREGRSTRIPAGKRVTMWSTMQFAGYNVVSTCRPALSMLTAEGRNVILSSGLQDGRCFIEAVREDASKETGVARELTLAGPHC